MSNKTHISMAEIQMGDNTHTHDQLITPVNFSTINTRVSSPGNPRLLEEFFDFDIIPPYRT